MNILENMNRLNAPACVSGCEKEISEIIAEMARPYCDEIWTDSMGSLFCLKRGSAPEPDRVMLAAHMDSIGMVVTYIEEEGYLRFGKIGGLNLTTLVGTPVRFSNGLRGVIAADGRPEPKALALDKLYIDVGATSREEALKLVRPGDAAVFATEAFETDSIVVSPYMDDRISCLILLELMQSLESPNDVYFVFTTQEEVGIRGAKTAAFSVDPAWAVAVDVAPPGDTPELKPKSGVKLGGGPIVKLMDGGSISSPVICAMLEESAKSAGIPFQFAADQAGGTDAASILTSRAGVPTGNLGVPTRYIHSPQEMISKADFENCVKLLREVLKRELPHA